MPTIALLPPAVVACIAAGEVIERPASLLRELTENALDAGARSLDIRIEDGGFAYLRVDDDGCGMEADDVPLAIQRYATAKLRTVADLTRLTTLGYRGEALAAAAICADLELVTSTGGVGTYLRTEQGRTSVIRGAARPQGTTVCAYRAFARMPGRRAALGSAEQESAHCQHVAASYALAHPGVAVRFVREGRLVFRTSGDGNLLEVMAALYPPHVVERLVPVDDSLGLPSGQVRVQGLIATPELTRRTREHLRIAINGRPITHAGLARAVESAYGPVLAASRHPVAFLHVQLPPSQVDANVHPGKATVRLVAEAAVIGLVRGAAMRALREVMPAERAIPRTAGTALEPASAEALAKARWLGHWNEAYLVLVDAEALYLVDQHAVAERVLYEEISQAGEPYRPSHPVALHLDPAQAVLLGDLFPQLRALGFELDPLGGGSWALRTVPAAWRDLPLADTFLEMLSDVACSSRIDVPAAAASAACHRALRRGTPLDETQARALIKAMANTGGPATCLHGRPAFLRLPLLAADRIFLRG